MFCNYCGASNSTLTCSESCSTAYCSGHCRQLDHQDHVARCSKTRSSYQASNNNNYKNSKEGVKVYSQVYSNKSFQRGPKPNLKNYQAPECSQRVAVDQTAVPPTKPSVTQVPPTKPRVTPDPPPQSKSKVTKPKKTTKPKISKSKSDNRNRFDGLDLDSLPSQSDSEPEEQGASDRSSPTNAADVCVENLESCESKPAHVISKSDSQNHKKLKKERKKAAAAARKKQEFLDTLDAARGKITKKDFNEAEKLLKHASTLQHCSLSVSAVRADLHVARGNHDVALKIFKNFLETHPDDVSAQKKFSECCLNTGDKEAWDMFYARMKTKELKLFDDFNRKMTSLTSALADIESKIKDRRYKEAYNMNEKLLSMMPSSTCLLFMKSKLLGLGKLHETAKDWFNNKKAQINAPEFASVRNVARGIFFYFSNKISDAWRSFELVDRVCFNSKTVEAWEEKLGKIEISIENMNEAWYDEDLKKAFKKTTKALQVDPENIHFRFEILMKRACLWRLKDKNCVKALEEITEALSINDNDPKAMFIKGKILFDLMKYEEARKDLKSCGLKKGIFISNVCEELMKPQNSHYDVLGLKKDASEAEIKAAYRAKARQYHPDKNSHASEKVRAEMELKMKEVSQAYR